LKKTTKGSNKTNVSAEIEATTSRTLSTALPTCETIVLQKLIVVVKVFSASRETGRSVTKLKSNQALEGMLSRINPISIPAPNCIEARFKIISHLWLWSPEQYRSYRFSN
jgi:hypothetical protein